MKVLVVGAGAVGQVVAHHLAAGGAEVEFYVKPAYALWHDRHAMLLQQLSFVPGRKFPLTVFQDYRLHTTVDSVADSAARGAFTAVYLTFAATDLHNGAEWIRALRGAVGGDTTLVLMTVGLSDRAFLVDTCGVPSDAVVQCAITIIAWSAPLPGEAFPVMPPQLAPVARAGRVRVGLTSDDSPMDVTEGSSRDHHVLPVAYVLEGTMPYFGSSHRAAPLLAALNAGGLPSAMASDLQLHLLFVFSAGLQMLVLLLEVCDWSFRRTLWSGRLWHAARAASEAMTATARQFGRPWMAALWLVLVPIYIFVLAAGPLIAPFDLQAYMRFHFSKVGPQTKLFGDEYVRAVESGGARATALRSLLALNPRWQAAPLPPPAA